MIAGKTANSEELKSRRLLVDNHSMCLIENLADVRARSLELDQFCCHPWRGTSYGDGDLAARVLVLGESTYLADRDELKEQYAQLGPHWFNHGVFNGYYANRWRDAFWTKWIASILNRAPQVTDRKTVLDQIAFYNYLDVILSGPRKLVSREQVIQAQGKFLQVLDQLKPELILNLSYRQYDNWLPEQDFEPGPDIVVTVNADTDTAASLKNFRTGHYHRSGRSLILRLPHPSTSAWINAQVWPAVQEALRRSGDRVIADLAA